MDQATHQRKLARLQDPHMQALLTYREELINRTHKVIPCFDPEDGGTRAELLLLMSHVGGDPGSSKGGSSFISMENEDQTASNLRRVVTGMGLNRENLLIWNVVPWQDGDPKKEADQGAVHLPRLVQLLPDLRGIAVLTKEGAVVRAVRDELAHGRRLEWVFTSSPAPRAFNRFGTQIAQDLERLARALSLV
ncbi:hypothetical protein [Deinococcus hohokamensis]|uniref:Uracil-DNA glycosylase n=1 Tax=Deinococcus hohokamensis TaxID=309883 RepID=A0ABV9IEK5_9DEIO